MPKDVTEFVYWGETTTVKADARQCWTFCLEAHETLVLSVTATRAIDAVLADWPSYSNWEHARFEGMPSGLRFMNDSQSVSWEETVADPPYMLVLVVANPAGQESEVSIKAVIRRAVLPRDEENHDRRGHATYLHSARWRG
jgi:hypothetical protein